MIARSHIDEDLQLKQFARSGADTKPRFDWAPTEDAPSAAIPVSTRPGESRIYTTGDIAGMIGDALTDLMLSRQEQEIFTDKNRRLVSRIATQVAGDLSASVHAGAVTAGEMARLIERALVRHNAYDLARSIITRHQMTTDHRDGEMDGSAASATLPACRVIRRNGHVVNWNQNKVEIALRKAFLSEKMEAEPAVLIARGLSVRLRDEGRQMIHIEELQDLVQEELMKAGHYKVAASYILYRAHRAEVRKLSAEEARQEAIDRQEHMILVKNEDGSAFLWDGLELRRRIDFARIGLDLCLNADQIENELRRSLFPEMTLEDLKRTVILNAKVLIERDADFAKFAGRIMLSYIYEEVLGWSIMTDGMEGLAESHRRAFRGYLQRGVEISRISPKLMEYDLDRLAAALDPSADMDFDFLGIQTLYDRYLIIDKTGKKHRRLETPQFFWMRVAMGLFTGDESPRRAEHAIALYQLYKGRRFCSSTPTLFNSGTHHSQLSSCYLYKVDDSIESIMIRGIAENAFLSKWAGGLGGSWTAVRGTGSYIQGTNGESQGVIPFLKLHNDQLIAVNQGGKRRGSGCAYLETWHNDIREFLELRRNTGDERRRTHDMNTANWIPDLFMKRLEARQNWTLFRSNECPELHDLYGRAFEEKYHEYEEKAARGEVYAETVRALDLWLEMLRMLFETGHPWITFKDPCNLRSPQDHCGVIHSSNLCCMTADQRIVTSKGIFTVAALYEKSRRHALVATAGGGGETVTQEIANTVFSRNAGPVPAGPMLLPRPDAPIVRIHTREGYTHKVTPDHKVWVVNKGWVEAQNLIKGDQIAIQNQQGLFGPVARENEALLCGLIAGDGTFLVREGSITAIVDVWTNEFPWIPEIEAAVAAVIADHGPELRTISKAAPLFCGDEYKQRLASAPLAKILAEFGFNRETKLTVPEFVWQGTRETVCAYLKGLYLADATVQGTGGVTTCGLASKSLEFIRELQILLANFGIKSSINKMRDAGTALLPDGHGGEQEYMQSALYRLLVTSVQGCRLLENITGIGAARQNPHYLSQLEKQGYAQKFHATFEALEILENEDAYCLQVFTEEHSWIANGIVTKNTEITLNTSEAETAVCNLGSIILENHLDAQGQIDHDKLRTTVRTAVRALDNVIDINFYPTEAAARANRRHRPIGLGVMGLANCLYRKNLPFASAEAVAFNDEIMEAVAYYAYEASSDLAAERGTYSSYEGSKWSRGLLPQDTLELLERERGMAIEVPRTSRMDWTPLRAKIAKQGMRNSNVLAIAPTATISNIMGSTPCIEPQFKNLYVKSNLSGEFIMLNEYLVRDLKARRLWSQEMLDKLKYYDGELGEIDEIPDDLKEKYRTAFAIGHQWLIEAAACRQKWIDQSQSLNLFLASPDLKTLSHMYRAAWRAGLKTTYYLRTFSASNAEKSTISVKKNVRISADDAIAAAPAAAAPVILNPAPKAPVETTGALFSPEQIACSIEARRNGVECEVCQ